MRPNFITSLKKGAIGEGIVKSRFKEMGYMIYSVENDSSHPFDLLIANMNTGKILLADVKTFPRRNKYKDNGINLMAWSTYDYWRKKNGVDFYIFFVDEMIGEIYGNEMSELEKTFYDTKTGITYPLIDNNRYSDNIIYFHLDRMVNFGKLTKDEILEIRKYSRRSYGYMHDCLKGDKER